MALTKPEAAFLERLFVADIEGGMPVQSKAKKLLAKLDGLIEHREVILPGRFPVKVSGYVLTMAGHIAYSEWAAEQPESATN